MALPGTDHVAKIAVGFLYGSDNQQCQNVFYVQDSTDNIFSNPSGFCDKVQVAAVANLVPQYYTSVQVNSVEFEDVRSVPFGGLVKYYTPVVGTKAGSAGSLPGNVVFAVKKGTGALGRSARGRWYWPVGDIIALQTDDTIKTAYAAAITTALAAFQAAVEAAPTTCLLGIVSYFNGGTARPAGLFQHVTSWAYADLNTDSQRRRLAGRGR